MCIVKDVFQEGISLDTAIAQVNSYAMSDMFYLPPGTIPPMLMPYDPTASLPLCLVVVSSPEMDEQQLYDIAYYELRNKLQSIQGVIAPAVFGGKLRRIYAYMSPEKLEAFRVTLMDVQRALARYNVLIPAGNMKAGSNDLQLFTNAIPETIDELNETQMSYGNDERGELYRTAAHPGYAIRPQGEVRSMRDSFSQFASGLVIAIVLVYLVMVAQFQSVQRSSDHPADRTAGLYRCRGGVVPDQFNAVDHVVDGNHHDGRDRRPGTAHGR